MVTLELARDRIRVNVVCPGWITPNIEEGTTHRNRKGLVVPVEYLEGFHRLSGGLGSAEQVARLMAFLLSDAADHISGSGMWIDGTESLVIG